jgi:Fic family protein
MQYNWQQPDWPRFVYDLSNLQGILLDVAEKTGVLRGMELGLPESIKTDTIIDMMVTEAIKNSEIEGEYLSRQDVMSSVRNNLGLNIKLEKVTDVRAKGISELMVNMRKTFNDPLSAKTLCAWHKMLMAGSRHKEVGCWRTHSEPMQVVSGAIHKPTVHFEAPPSTDVPKEMERFIKWFNDTAPGKKHELRPPALRSAVVHLYFESIHPFVDGNGRMGRILSEKALFQSIGSPVLLSLSKAIESKRSDYYNALKRAQHSNEITDWVSYFILTLLSAQIDAERLIEFTLSKAHFFDHFRHQLNERQAKVISRILAEGPSGFQGGINARKYTSMTGASKATATRDLQQLHSMGILQKLGGGRSVRYEIDLHSYKTQ